MTVKSFRRALVCICFVLPACGGGSSSSGGGGAVSNESQSVSGCISRTDDVSVEPLGEPGGPVLTRYDTTFTNNCDFAVNVGIAATSNLRRVSLGPGMSVNHSAIIVKPSFIACRPPSQPINTAGEFDVFVTLGCS